MPKFERRVIGIDLGGASSETTAYTVLQGGSKPRLIAARLLEQGSKPAEGEAALFFIAEKFEVDSIAIDAPLTLPPCLTCPDYCRGPGPDLCELEDAREMWAEGGNPVSGRRCERIAKEKIPDLGTPLPTMQLGVLVARAVALARKLRNSGVRPWSMAQRELMEVYPQATLSRLGEQDERLAPKRKGEDESKYRSRVIAALGGPTVEIEGLGEAPDLQTNPHVFDSLICAYTAWLSPTFLEQPPDDLNPASGWIWFPRPAKAPPNRPRTRPVRF